jgi:hypothetical protein
MPYIFAGTMNAELVLKMGRGPNIVAARVARKAHWYWQLK